MDEILKELFEACRNGDLTKVKKFITSENINAQEILGRKSTPLHFSSGFGRKDVVEYLLNQNANVHMKDDGGLIPLHNAASFGHAQMVQLLLNHHSDVNALDNWNFSPLAEAASKGKVDVCLTLLQHGADPNLKNSDGKCALDLADSSTRPVLTGEYRKDELLEAARSGNEEKLLSLLTSTNVNCHASDGRKRDIIDSQFVKYYLNMVLMFYEWVDGHFYPGIIANINGEKYMIDFDDGAKRYVKSSAIISQSYLEANQNVMAQTQDGSFDRGIVKRLIKKKKTGKLGYIVDTNGKEKWYPLRFISLTLEQAEHLPIVNSNNNNTEELINSVQGKRKRASNVPQSPNKKTKSSIFLSPNKSQRSTYTPTRQTKLFNSMYFLLTGFNDSMDIRHNIQDFIDSHGGKVIEKIPNANRRDNVYLISDMARKTAKFFDAKKLNIPSVNYQWINESIEKGEVQDWEVYKLILPEKQTKINDNKKD